MSANFFRKHLFVASLLALGVFALAPSLQPVAVAQNNTSGDIAGTVTDPSGAAIAGASVTITSKSSGSSKTVTSGAHGEYRASLLEPGDYAVAISAAGFQGEHTVITVAIGQIASGDVKLSVGKTTTVVDVAASEPLLHTEDAQISTSFSMEQIQALPNPGNDLTFVAQTSPGAVMNTQSGYGNFSVFGLPGTANTFTVNGGYDNDPFLNVNNSGATNLLLGNNDVADVTVTSNAYDAAFGGLGAAQVSEITRSGSNGFHGDAHYWWNGSSLNANSYFNNQSATPIQFDNVNQFAAAFGGPIKKDKVFFFGNYEGLRVVLPTNAVTYAPDATYQANTLANLTANGLTSEIPVYQNIFNYYNVAAAKGNPVELPASQVDPGYGIVQFNATAGNFTHEYLYDGRVDVNISSNDKLFVRAKVDKGVQATYTSLLNPVFDALSPQPEYESQLQETHTFTPNLTNQFLLAQIYYGAIFANTSQAAAEAQVPFSLVFLDGALGNNPGGAYPGGEDFAFPQGRNVNGYQFQDDLSWSKGNHTVKVGWAMRRDDVTDYSPSEFTGSPLALAFNTAADNQSFQNGYVDIWEQDFPLRSTQPVALYTMGAYIQDQWKALPNLTVTYGLRLEHDSNPTCITNCYARLNGSFGQQGDNGAVPFNQLLATGEHRVFQSYQHVGYEPRVGFSWLPMGAGTKTVIRGGFGMFSDSFPAQIADSLLNNAPTNVPTEVFGAIFGNPAPIVPSAPNSAASQAAAIANGFRAGFASGGTAAQSGAINVTTAATHISYPTYEEFSLALEQQVTRTTAVSATYVGNHGYHEPIVDAGLNGFGFGGLPSSPTSPSFGGVTDVFSGGSSNYNGVIGSVVNRQRYLTLQFNYEYSHALDIVSNGGFDPFGANSVGLGNPYNPSTNYGNADYDTRQYVSGSYVFTMPYFGGPRVLTDNFQIAGTLFHNNGYPFSVTDSSVAIQNFSGPVYAQQIAPLTSNACGGEAHVTNPTGLNQVPCSFVSSYAPAGATTYLAASRRNQISGPHFTDADLDVTKGFAVPKFESGKLNLGVQFFNIFNHPNFAQPSGNVAGNTGLISGTVNPPTSILGSFLGGDASPRLIQLKASFVF